MALISLKRSQAREAMASARDMRLGSRYWLRTNQGELLVEGRAVPIGARAFEVLRALAESAGLTMSKRELMDRVWPDAVVEENNLHVQISNLRRLLGPAAIVTVAGRGYRLTLDCEVQPERYAPGDASAPDGSSPMHAGVAMPPPAAPLLLEREEAMHALAECLARARSGHGSVCLLSGGAGTGKKALCSSFLAASDVRCLRGSCDEFIVPRRYCPFVDFLAEIDAGLTAMMSREGSEAEIFLRTLQLLRARPTVACLENLQWADAATLDLFRYLARRVGRSPVLLLGSYRDDELGEHHPLRPLLGDLQGHVTRVRLHPLSAAAVARLAKALGRNAEEILALTGGNPFEVTEILKDGDMPQTVREAVQARLAKLGAAEQDLLELVAIASCPVEHWLVQRLLEPGEEGQRTLRLALASGLICGDDRASISYRRELDRRIVAAAIGAHRLPRLHARLLQALATDAPTSICPARCLAHARAAGDTAQAARFALLEAQERMQRGEYREVAALCRSTLADADAALPERRAHLLELLSVARSRFEPDPLSARADLEESLRIWRELGSDVDQGRLLRRLARLSWLLGDGAQARVYARASVERLQAHPESPEYRRALSDQAMTLYFTSAFREALEVGERALTAAGRCGDLRVRSLALTAAGGAYAALGESGTGFAHLEEALALALEGSFVFEAAISYVNLARSCYIVREYARLEKCASEALAFLLSGKDMDIFANRIRAIQSIAAFEEGNWPRAESVAQALVDQGANRPMDWIERAVLALVRAGRGDPGGAGFSPAPAAKAPEHLQLGGTAIMAAAQVRWLRDGHIGEREPLREALARARDAGFGRQAQEFAYWLWLDGDAAVAVVDPGSPRGLQMAGRWQDAARAWRVLGCPLEEAQSLLQGDAQARAHAREILSRLGAVAWLGRAGDADLRRPPIGA